MIVTSKKVALRSSLEVRPNVIDWLDKGEEVKRVDDKNYYNGLFDYVYYKVKTKGGVEGYVRAGALE